MSLIVDARCGGGGGGGGGATPVMSSLVLVIYLSGFKSPWLPVESNQIEMRLRVLSASEVWCQWSESNQIERDACSTSASDAHPPVDDFFVFKSGMSLA